MQFTSLFRRPRSRFSHKLARNPRRDRRYAVEALEDRVLLNAGDLDLSFGDGGKVITDFGTADDVANDMAIQDDGKIVVVGHTAGTSDSSIPRPPRDILIARYNVDGTLDSTFGTAGRVVTDISHRAEANGVAIDSAGRIVVAALLDDGAARSNFTLLRYNSDGSLDSTLDGDGIVINSFPNDRGGAARALLIQADGRIVVAGDRFAGPDDPVPFTNDFALMRFNENGSLDATFGGNGLVTTELGANEQIRSLALQPDGKIVAVGIGNVGEGWDFALARYNPDGSLDTTFDSDGKIITDLGELEQAFDVLIQTDGRIVAIGQSSLGSEGGFGAVVRYNPDGSLDTTFDADGIALTPNIQGGAHAGALAGDGKIVVAGSRGFTTATFVARFNTDGTLDPTFGGGSGLVTTDFSPSLRNESANGIAIQANGRIVTAGVSNQGSDDQPDSDVSLARYLADIQPIAISGVVFDDLDNDGLFDPGDGETGIEGVTVILTGTDDQGAVNRSTVTGTDGSYSFDDVFAGNYTLTEEQPTGLLDGIETAGNLGGTVDNSQDSNSIADLTIANGDPDATDYNFAEIRPSDALGLVWEDFNNDGEVNFGEKAIENVTVNLAGTDDRGNAVSRTVVTDVDGIYMFIDLRPGDYSISEVQPSGFTDGLDTLGTVNGVSVGDNSVNDVFSDVVISVPGSVAQNYNFGERPEEGGAVTSGQTATIGFWMNNNGQALIDELNGGATSTQLADWLASTFGNMYGVGAGTNDLTGMSNSEVGDFYSDLFRRKKKEAIQLGLGGPVKMDAQVMAVALATYVTNVNLAGTVAESYGFLVTETGVGTSTFNVGDSGEAFGVADNSELTILDLLFATNDRSVDGVLYDTDGDGDADDSYETLLRTLANDVYSAINEAGDI